MMKGMTKPFGWWALLGLLTMRILLIGILSVQRNQRLLQKSRSEPRDYSNARESVVKMIKAGVSILAGNDAHSETSSATNCNMVLPTS